MKFEPYRKEEHSGNKTYLGLRVTQSYLGLPIRMARLLRDKQWAYVLVDIDIENKAIRLTQSSNEEPHTYKIGWQNIGVNLSNVLPEGRYLFDSELSDDETIVVVRKY